jgi:hypothetical protein
MGAEPISKMPCTSNIPQTVDNVQNNIGIMHQSSFQTCRESLFQDISVFTWMDRKL